MSLECFTLQLDLDCREGYYLEDDNEDLNEILEKNSCDTCESDKPESEIISPESFLKVLNIVRSFTQTNGASENTYQALHELELIGITKRINDSTNQKAIEIYFSKKSVHKRKKPS